jgi:DNA-binding response OmpR family regulator
VEPQTDLGDGNIPYMVSPDRSVVLVADDDPIILELITFALRRSGYIAIAAPDGPTALRLCQDSVGPIHLAVLDVTMPGMSGPELFECLQQSYPKVQVVFISGYRPEDIPPLSMGTELHFMAKPFFPKDLVLRVNAILGNSEGDSANANPSGVEPDSASA